MAVGLSVATANAFLDALGNGVNYTADPAIWVQLHTADPGAAGTTAIAGNATRKLVSFGAPAGGVMSNDTAITWTTGEVDTAEDYTHLTLWSLAAAGTFRGSGLMTANAVLIGDEFVIPIGDLDLSFPVAA